MAQGVWIVRWQSSAYEQWMASLVTSQLNSQRSLAWARVQRFSYPYIHKITAEQSNVKG
jgi:hypothetical protein